MLIDGAKYNVIHFWKAYGMPNKDWPIFNSKINFDFYFINWWFEAVWCDIDSGITLASLNTQKSYAPKFHSKFCQKSKNYVFNFFSSQKLEKIMAWIKTLYIDFELTVDECLFGMYQAFQKCITLYFAPSLSMDCTVASCVLLTGSGKYSKNIEWQNLF